MTKSKRTNYETLKTFTKAQVNGLTKLFSSTRFGSDEDRNAKINDLFDSMLHYNGTHYVTVGNQHHQKHIYHFNKSRKITKEQTVLGKAYLKQYFYKLDGTPRSGKRTTDLPEGVLAIANKVTRFEFIGVVAHCNYVGNAVSYSPLYRSYNAKGDYFDYSPQHWSAPIITEVKRFTCITTPKLDGVNSRTLLSVVS